MLTLLAPSRPAPALRKAPEVYAPPIAQAYRLLGLTDADAPTLQQQRTAYRGLVYACETFRSEAVGEAMLDAVAAREVRKDEATEVEGGHPWARLLRNPNPSYSAYFLWKWMQEAKDLSRGAFFWIERDRARVPLYLHPIFPYFGDVLPVGSSDGGIEGYVFHRSDGTRQSIPVEDVVWIRHPHPVSPYESASLIEAAAYEIDSDLYAHVYRRDLYRDGGAPQLQLKTDQELTQDQQIEAADTFARFFSGRANRSKVPVFGKGSELKPVGLSPEDMEMTNTLVQNGVDIMRIFRIPEGLMSKDPNRAAAEQAERTFTKWMVKPQLIANCDQLTTDLRRAFGAVRGAADMVLVVLPPKVVAMDPEQARLQDESDLRSGKKTLNELRERDGAKKYGKEGDVPLVSAALVPLEQVVKPPEPPPALVPADDVSAETSEDEPEDELERKARAWSQRSEDELARAWRALDDRKQSHVRPIMAAAAALIARMGEEVISRLRASERSAKRDKGAPVEDAGRLAAEILDIVRWADEMADGLGPGIRAALIEGFGAAMANVQAAGGTMGGYVENASARRALARVVARTRSVPETARGHLETALRNGLAAGEDVEALAARVRALFDELAEWKARQISITASTAAFEAGQLEAYREADVEKKRWLTMRDGDVRDSHVPMDGEEIALGEAFSNGAQSPGDSGDPSEDINERCSMLPVIGPDRGASTWAKRRNDWMRREYLRRRRAGEERSAIVEDLATAEFEGRGYALAFDTARKACDGLTP